MLSFRLDLERKGIGRVRVRVLWRWVPWVGEKEERLDKWVCGGGGGGAPYLAC